MRSFTSPSSRSADAAGGRPESEAACCDDTARLAILSATVSPSARRPAYEAREDREDWLRYRLGADGVYVARPKCDGGGYKSPTVKAGSMFANPFVVGDGKDKYTVSESLDHFRRYVEARAAPDASENCA